MSASLAATPEPGEEPATEAVSDRGTGRRGWTRRVAAAGTLLIALLAVGGLYAAFAPRGQADSTGATSLAISQGRALFLQGCASCHGLQAQGTKLGPSLIGVGSAAVDFQVGTGRMPLAREGPQAQARPPQYSQAQIDQMAAYVASLAPGPKSPTKSQLDLNQGDLAKGGELFRNNCAQCHNFVGKGGALTYGRYAPSIADTSPQHIYEAMQSGPENMPVFADTQITPEQKRDIIAYVKHVHAQADPGGAPLGRTGPVPEGAVAWIAGMGLLVVATLWIGARS